MIVLILDKTDETALQMDTAIDLTQPVGDVSGYLMNETALQMDTAIDLTQPVGDVSGYLMKEGNNLVKDWKRRWFVFTPLELRYYKKEGVRRVGHMTLVIALQI